MVLLSILWWVMVNRGEFFLVKFTKWKKMQLCVTSKKLEWDPASDGTRTGMDNSINKVRNWKEMKRKQP